jgi:hypothetical protein
VLYYYLIASLPELKMDEPPGVSLEQFIFRCQGILDQSAMHDLNKVLTRDTNGIRSAQAAQWLAADTQLRNAVARMRAAHLNIDAIGFIKDHSGARMYIESAVRDAFARDNPLERELALDKCRWFILDELAFADRFGLGAVIAFGVKLQIVERWCGYNAAAGREGFDKFILNNLEAQGFPTVVENSA